MRGKNTIIINGRAYDAVTGQPARIDSLTPASQAASATSKPVLSQAKGIISDFGLTARRSTAPKRVVTGRSSAPASQPRTLNTAHAVHAKPQRSKTLRRQAIKRPDAFVAPKQMQEAATAVPAAQKSPLIRKFADRKVSPLTKPAFINGVTPKGSHASSPAVARAKITPVKPVQHEVQATKPSTVLQNNTATIAKTPSQHVKEQLIKERLSEVSVAPKPKQRSINSLLRGQARGRSIVTMGLALVMLGGYLTYINMPNLSVRVASARAGINAGFPEYNPSGYRFAGPVAYTPGEVIIRFKSNTNSQGYTVKQRASNWDSQAVLDNFVTRESSSYLTYSEQGLTVYTYGNKAAWVNGGVLYTIDGNAPLSSEQILRIAASM